ncbi:MAG: hypothetical protein AB7Q42_15790 [Acidimicrobiia bacterium]
MPGLPSPTAHVRPFADWLLARDLPGLDDDRRRATVAFVLKRIDGLPDPMAIGVLVVAMIARGLLAVPGGRAVLGLLVRRPLPLAGEYVRLVRSLGYAYIWDAWPDARPDGSIAA